MEEQKKKYSKKLRFLTVVMILAIIATTVHAGMYAYNILSSGKALQKQDDAEISEKQRLEEERRKQEEKLEQGLQSGVIAYIPNEEQTDLDNVIVDQNDAYQLLVELQYDLGIEDAEREYEYAYSSAGKDFTIYTMQQYYEGVEVYGAEIKITVDQSGNLTEINGKYQKIEGFSVEAVISENDAQEKTEKYLKREYQYNMEEIYLQNQGKQICILNNEDATLVYMFEVSNSYSGPVFRRILIDANTGDVVSDNSMIDFEMITLNSDDQNSPLKKPQGQRVVQTLDVWKASDTRYTLEDTERHIMVGLAESTDIPIPNSPILIEWNPQNETPNASGIDAMANLQRIYDYYLEQHQRAGTKNDGNNTNLQVTVGVENVQNSSYIDNAGMAGTDYMYIAKRSNASNPEYSEDMNVLSHEYTHGVTNGASNLLKATYTYDRQNSVQLSIGEALADIYAEFIEDYSDGGFDNSCNWSIGGDGIRDLENPGNSAESGTHLTDAKDFVEGTTNCHNGSTIISHPVYLMANGIDGDDDKKISTETLANMWYQSIGQMTSSTDFQEVRKLIEQKAVNLNNTSRRQMSDEQLECIIDAFDRTGILHSYNYALTPNATIQVYDQNNELYDNYNITVHKRGGDQVLSEDVKEKSYKLELDPGIYELILTDLENEDLIYTFSLIVNDNDSKDKVEDYKKKESFYTDFGCDERQVVLVLDVSGSMNGTPLSETKKAAVKFVNTVLKESPATKISIVTYSDSVSTVIESSSKKSKLRSAINGLGSGGRTNMHSALDSAQVILDLKKAEKKMMVVMSDGLPNEGNQVDFDYNAAVIELANEIKQEDIFIYSLGFFHNLSGDELAAGTSLMAQIASSGYHYNVTDTNDIQYVFSGIANDVSGKDYILIRIACPVDVTIKHNGEVLSSAERTKSVSTEFGLLSFEGENDEVKILRLETGTDYEICIDGNGKGTMDYSISYPGKSGEYTDVRTFQDVPINRRTTVATNTRQGAHTTLKVDTDGNGTFDLKYIALKDNEAVEMRTFVLYVIAVLAGVIGMFILAIVILITAKRSKKAKVCPSCGCEISKKTQFCQNCGTAIVKSSFFRKEKKESRPQPKWARNFKIVVIGICILANGAVYFMQNCAATTVFMQIKQEEYVSAQMLYERSVEDSGISKKYLSFLLENYTNKINAAHEKKKINDKKANDVYENIVQLDVGPASEQAETYLEQIK